MTSSRVAKTYTLSMDAVNALESRGKETGEKLSRLVEQGIRLVCAMPPEAKEEGETELAPTRSMRDTLVVLEQMGPGPWSTWEIEREAGFPVEKYLRALRREGKVHLWGRGGYNLVRKENGEPSLRENGEPRLVLSDTGERWDLQTPMQRVMELVAKWKAHGGKPWKYGTSPGAMTSGVRDAIQKLVLSVDDIAPVLDAVAAEMGENSVHEWLPGAAPGLPTTSSRFRNAAQQIEHERSVAAARTPAERAQQLAEMYKAVAEQERKKNDQPLADGLEIAQKRIAEFQRGEITTEAKIAVLGECRALEMKCSPADRAAIEQMLREAGVTGSYGPPPPSMPVNPDAPGVV